MKLARLTCVAFTLFGAACAADPQRQAAPDLSLMAADDLASGAEDLGSLDLRTRDLASLADLIVVSGADLATSSPGDLAGTGLSTWSASSGLPSLHCVPWSLAAVPTSNVPSVASSVMTLPTVAASDLIIYSHAEGVLSTPATLVIEARVRFVSGTSSSTRSGVSIGFRYGAAGRRNTLYIEDGAIFVLSDSSTKGAAASVATKDAMHTYRITVDTTTHALTVARDGVTTLTGDAFLGSDPSTPTVYFGDSSGVALGSSEWEYVGHNATSCP